MVMYLISNWFWY